MKPVTPSLLNLPNLLNLLTLLAGTLTGVGAQAETPYSFANTPGKLPKAVLPLHYTIHLQPDLSRQRFSGTEHIEIRVLQATRKIVLNVADLEVDAASLHAQHQHPQILTPQIDPNQQTLSFALPRPLKPGRYCLALHFRGKINQQDRGLFSVPDANGDANGDAKRTVLATTLEPADARRVFPAWDEPIFRAKFSLSVDLPTRFSAYSNTPILHDQASAPGMHRVSFATTPKMASYLFVLVAGELARRSVVQDGVESGVIAQPEKMAGTEYALANSQVLIRYFNQYFGLPYPLKKLDHIALPGSIHGAMENWGGIVYHEKRLLWDPKTDTQDDKQDIFNVIAHETAHQWFGNLVTTAWWNNLWLNEGFASWMQAKAAAQLHPEWNSRLEDMLGRENSMNLDARQNSHPIQQTITNEDQAAAAFDGITYGKASAVLGMLESYIGEEAFGRGIRAYMRRHQYSNATSTDLWAALEHASGKPVGRIASGWITQAGLPLLELTQSCKSGQRHIIIKQHPFMSDNSAGAPKLWQIPVQAGTLGGKVETILLQQASTRLVRPGCTGQWVLDPNSVGYFRVQYAQAERQALIAQVAQLPAGMRLKLVSDVWALVVAGSVPLTDYLNLITRLQNEPHQAVWGTILTSLTILDKLARNTAQQAPLQKLSAQLLLPQLEKLGWDEQAGDNQEQRLNRSHFIQHLIQIGDAQVISQAQTRFQSLLQDPNSLSPSSKNWVLTTIGTHANSQQYQQLLTLANQAQSNSERNQTYYALLRARNPQLAAQSLPLALRADLPNDITGRVATAVANSGHHELAWRFAVDNREALQKQQGALQIHRFFPDIMQSSLLAEHAGQLEQFARQYLGEQAQIEARRIGEGIRLQARRKEKLLPQLAQALNQDKP